MKKNKRLPFGAHLSQPLSEIEQESAKDLFVQKAHQKQPEIELNFGHGVKALFKLITIQPEDIESKTTVYRGNARIQSALNAFTLRDLLPSVRTNGMTFPAIGRQLPDGTYEVLDGSRRRMACLLARQPYYLYITNSSLINESNAQYLSDVANVHKQLSQYEQGRRYSELLKSGLSLEDVARQEGISKPKVCQARDAYELPEAFYHAHASGFELGRPRITSYRNMLKQASEAGFEEELIEFVTSISSDDLAKGLDLETSGLKQIIIRSIKSVAGLGGDGGERFSGVLACSTVAELMGYPSEIEVLGLSEAIVRAIDRAAIIEISDAFEELIPTSKHKSLKNSRSVFEGQRVTVISDPVKDGVRMTFHKVSTEQQQAIEKMIADFLAENELSGVVDTE